MQVGSMEEESDGDYFTSVSTQAGSRPNEILLFSQHWSHWNIQMSLQTNRSVDIYFVVWKVCCPKEFQFSLCG